MTPGSAGALVVPGRLSGSGLGVLDDGLAVTVTIGAGDSLELPGASGVKSGTAVGETVT